MSSIHQIILIKLILIAHEHTESPRIPCHATPGSISGQQCYEFGVNETRQSGLVWSRISYSDQNNWYISRHPNRARCSVTRNSGTLCISQSVTKWLTDCSNCKSCYSQLKMSKLDPFAMYARTKLNSELIFFFILRIVATPVVGQVWVSKLFTIPIPGYHLLLTRTNDQPAEI